MAFLLIPELQFSRHLNFFPILDLHPSVLRIFFWDHPQRCSRDCMEYKHSYPIWLHAMQASLAHYTFFSSKIYFRQRYRIQFYVQVEQKNLSNNDKYIFIINNVVAYYILFCIVINKRFHLVRNGAVLFFFISQCTLVYMKYQMDTQHFKIHWEETELTESRSYSLLL